VLCAELAFSIFFFYLWLSILYRFPLNAPDLAVEIISPDEKSEEMMDKVDEYLEQGAKMVWLVFPKRREVWVSTGASIYQRVRTS